MKTKVLTLEEIDEAASLLLEGEVICFPTETVYGIGTIADSKKAFDKLVAAKRRPPTKPFSLMCSSREELPSLCELDEAGERVAKAYMPGSITILAKAKEGLPDWVTLGTTVIGIRIPDSEYVLSLIKKVGKPLMVTSANKSGEPTSRYFEETKEAFDGEVPAIVKGECVSLEASTIVDISTPGVIRLIREGPIPFAEIKKTWEGK
ncbi:MAG: threonylcarbamoyl-AMP synthase [Bacilli bacterium]|nr:threonylcarbamoyl-AMP synthase [Bacilli bacterium]